jgi:protein CpxP
MMKKMILIVIACATLHVSAQEQKRAMKKQHRIDKASYSPEESAQLQTKRLTLKLDLNEQQQKEISTLFLEEATLRQSKKDAFSEVKAKTENNSLTKEDRLKIKNDRLDHLIDRKKKMKTILSTEQYDKWEKMSLKQHQNRKQLKAQNKTKESIV